MIKHIELVNKNNMILRGYLDMPDNFNGNIVVMYHGFTGNKTEHAGHFRNLSRLISKNGFASLRMDFSGNGESDGEFYDFTMDTMMDEAKQILDYAFNIEGVKKVTVLGFSMGGAVSSMISGIYGNKISNLVLWSAAANICEHIKKYYETGIKKENGNSMHGNFELSKEMYLSTDKYDTMKNIEIFTNPVLICHGTNDTCIDPNYSKIYNSKYVNSKVHFIEGAGHGYDGVSEQEDLYNTTLSFLNENK